MKGIDGIHSPYHPVHVSLRAILKMPIKKNHSQMFLLCTEHLYTYIRFNMVTVSCLGGFEM